MTNPDDLRRQIGRALLVRVLLVTVVVVYLVVRYAIQQYFRKDGTSLVER